MIKLNGFAALLLNINLLIAKNVIIELKKKPLDCIFVLDIGGQKWVWGWNEQRKSVSGRVSGM